jgi:rhodanese-related sulfurtransferase
MKSSRIRAITISIATALAVSTLPNTAFADDPQGSGNRYDLERNYTSEVSAARAFADTVAISGKWGNPSSKPVLIDVRGADEYTAGHPEHSISIPFPRAYRGPCDVRYPDGNCNTDEATPVYDTVSVSEEDFVSAVLAAIPKKDTPIYTMCRTGYRSVLAANLLVDAGYTNVRNIWEGFVGRHKVDADGNTPLDLNNDGVIDDLDKDGWRYYSELPYDTRVLPNSINPILEAYYNLD